MTYEEQYLTYLDTILTKGKWVYNERTGEKCLTLINYTFSYELEDSVLLTSKQSFPVSAIAEILGYLRGYTNAQQFSDIGTNTWIANANENKDWLDNPNRKGLNDMGNVYGAIGRNFGGIDLLMKVYLDLLAGKDDRSEIITFYKPDEFDKGCLRPCLYSHHFSLLEDKLFLNSTQRSMDAALGGNFNSIQCYFLLLLMSTITDNQFGACYHTIVNNHIYEKHIEGVKKMLKRKPLPATSRIILNDWVANIDDVIGDKHFNRHAREYVTVEDYEHLGKIGFKMAV